MHKLGDDLVSLQDELKDINTIMRESKMGSPMPCGKAALSAVIACHADRDECTSRELAVAARGFDLAMSFLGTDGDRSSESVLEAARTFLDEAGIAEASGLSQAVSAMLAR
jgi:hypothetical protein